MIKLFSLEELDKLDKLDKLNTLELDDRLELRKVLEIPLLDSLFELEA